MFISIPVRIKVSNTFFIGTVVALKGQQVDGGKFEVHEFCYSTLPIMKNPTPKIKNDRLVNSLNEP